MHGVYKVLHKALNDAVKAGLVTRNVADMVNKPKQDKKPRPTLDPEEARRFTFSLACNERPARGWKPCCSARALRKRSARVEALGPPWRLG